MFRSFRFSIRLISFFYIYIYLTISFDYNVKRITDIVLVTDCVIFESDDVIHLIYNYVDLFLIQFTEYFHFLQRFAIF